MQLECEVDLTVLQYKYAEVDRFSDKHWSISIGKHNSYTLK